MEFSVGPRSLGTSEAEWSMCSRLAAVDPWDIRRPPRNALVVAPHPDDETLGIGGIISILSRMNSAIKIFALTDGEHCHPQSQTIRPDELAVRRVQEQREALTTLGVTSQIIRLKIEDGKVATRTLEIVDWIEANAQGADICFAPFRNDGHPDHDAAGDAAWAACADLKIPLLEYPIWAWHWARPNSDDLPWSRARRIDLDAEAMMAKAHAIQKFKSQINPLSDDLPDSAILPPSVLMRFRRRFEIVFT